MEEQNEEKVNVVFKYIQIIERDSTIFYKRPVKTKVFLVKNHVYDCNIGWIKWHCGWRKYTFYPDPETFYEEVCMKDIAGFLEELNKKGRDI